MKRTKGCDHRQREETQGYRFCTKCGKVTWDHEMFSFKEGGDITFEDTQPAYQEESYQPEFQPAVKQEDLGPIHNLAGVFFWIGIMMLFFVILTIITTSKTQEKLRPVNQNVRGLWPITN